MRGRIEKTPKKSPMRVMLRINLILFVAWILLVVYLLTRFGLWQSIFAFLF